MRYFCITISAIRSQHLSFKPNFSLTTSSSMKRVLILFAAVAMLASCNSKKRLAEIKTLQDARDKAVASLNDCDQRTATLRSQLSAKDTDLQGKDKQVADLQAQIDYLKKTNTNLLDRMSDLSIVSKSGAESIKKSLETLNEQTKYTNNLNSIHSAERFPESGARDEPETVTGRYQRPGCTG